MEGNVIDLEKFIVPILPYTHGECLGMNRVYSRKKHTEYHYDSNFVGSLCGKNNSETTFAQEYRCAWRGVYNGFISEQEHLNYTLSLGSEKEKKMTKEQILEKLKEQNITVIDDSIEVYYVGDVGDKRFKKGSFVSAPSLTCYPTKERAVEDFHVGNYISRSAQHSIREQLKQVNDELWLVSISIDDIISMHSHGIEMEATSLKCVKKIAVPFEIKYSVQGVSTHEVLLELKNTLTGNYATLTGNYAKYSIEDAIEEVLKADDSRVKILKDTKDGIKIDI